MNRYCISNQLVQHKPRDIYSIETYACLDDTLIYNFSLKTPSNKFQPCYFVYCLCVELVCDYYSLKVHPQQEVFCHDCSLSAPKCYQNSFLENNEQAIDNSFCSILVHISGAGLCCGLWVWLHPSPNQNSVVTIKFSHYIPASGQAATKCCSPINFALALPLAHLQCIHPNLPMQ